MPTEAERRAFAAGAKRVEEQRDIRASERIATALERIATVMESDRMQAAIFNGIGDALFKDWQRKS